MTNLTTPRKRTVTELPIPPELQQVFSQGAPDRRVWVAVISPSMLSALQQGEPQLMDLADVSGIFDAPLIVMVPQDAYEQAFGPVPAQ